MNFNDTKSAGDEPRHGFDFMTEREKFQNNLAVLRQTTKEMSARVRTLHHLHQEIEFRKADLLALRVKLSGIARKYELELTPTEKNRSAQP